MNVTRELIEEEGYNPGAQVRLVLSEELPVESYDARSFANAVDRALLAHGRLFTLIRDSTLDYCTRRLVAGAHFVLASRRLVSEDPAFTVALRQYLRDYTELSNSTRERLIPLLREAASLRDKRLGRKKKRAFRKSEREKGRTMCYLCGREMEFDFAESEVEASGEGTVGEEARVASKLRATVEHVWPRRLGGINRDANLLLACERCNGIKDDALTGTDFHYERFVRAEQESMTIEDQMMAWFHAGLRCAHCERPPIQVGELYLVRDDEGDCWHIHNVSAYCSLHVPSDRD